MDAAQVLTPLIGRNAYTGKPQGAYAVSCQEATGLTDEDTTVGEDGVRGVELRAGRKDEPLGEIHRGKARKGRSLNCRFG